MLIESPKKIDHEAVGCILTFENKYFLVLRTKDSLWNSITGNIEEKDNNPESAIKRELLEEINILVQPKYFTTTYHKYSNQIVKYYLFCHNLSEKEFQAIKLNKEHKDKGLFTLEEALKLNLYEDEDYCLKLHHKKCLKK